LLLAVAWTGFSPAANPTCRVPGGQTISLPLMLVPSSNPALQRPVPWVSWDTLQPPRSSGKVAQENSMRRMAAMVDLCLAID
jgi:hypothetical protein